MLQSKSSFVIKPGFEYWWFLYLPVCGFFFLTLDGGGVTKKKLWKSGLSWKSLGNTSLCQYLALNADAKFLDMRKKALEIEADFIDWPSKAVKAVRTEIRSEEVTTATHAMQQLTTQMAEMATQLAELKTKLAEMTTAQGELQKQMNETQPVQALDRGVNRNTREANLLCWKCHKKGNLPRYCPLGNANRR